MAVAEFVTKQHAICVVCGNPANFSQRKTLSREQVLLGATDVYEARCRQCFTVPDEEQLRLFDIDFDPAAVDKNREV
jgi:thymidine kinase